MLWANILAFIVNEMRAGGILNTLIRSNKFSVVDALHNTPATVEPKDRSTLRVSVG